MSDTPNIPLTFEESMAELERIIRDLEEGQGGLEDALANYESGVGLLKHCYQHLNHAEQRILLLAGVDEEGKAVTQPFAHAASTDAENTGGKKRRKKADEPEKLF